MDIKCRPTVHSLQNEDVSSARSLLYKRKHTVCVYTFCCFIPSHEERVCIYIWRETLVGVNFGE